MRLLTYLFLLFLSLNTFAVIAQSDYLDLSYGSDGIASIETHGISIFFNHYGIDSEQSFYVSGIWISSIAPDEHKQRYIFKKLNKSGELQDWGIDMELDTLIPFNEKVYQFYWMENDAIFSYGNVIDQNDTFRVVKKYDLDLNEQIIYKTEMPTFLGNDWYSNDSYMQYDPEGRLYMRFGGKIKRFTNGGNLDESFGDSGTLKVIDHSPNWQLSQFLYNDLELYEEAMYYTIIQPNADSTEFYSSVIKYNREGVQDISFGDQGSFHLPPSTTIHFLSISNTGDINIMLSQYTNNDLCLDVEYDILKLSTNGQVNSSYGNNGYLANEDCLPIELVHHLEGPEGRIIGGYLDTVNVPTYKLVRFDLDGQLDSSFGEAGEVVLDFVPGKVIRKLLLDEDYNLYIVSYKDWDWVVAENTIYVTKLLANKIWPNITPKGLSDFDFKLFPNPSTQGPYLMNLGEKRGKLSVSIFDVSGRLVSIKYLEKLDTNETKTISESNLSSGSYIIKISDERSQRDYFDKIIILE